MLNLRWLSGFVVAMAATQAGADTISCGGMKSYREVISCAEQNAPEILQLEATSKAKKAHVDVATQWLNPELALQSVSGTSQSDRKTETDVSLAFPIELGSKRSGRKQVAEANSARSESELLLAKSQVRKTAFLKLTRLRQILDEVELVEESRETFTKLVRQYESRPARSPEQDVSLTVFKIAKSEYGLKRLEFDEELSDLESYFKISTGLTLEDLKKVLPPKVAKWPALKAQGANPVKSPTLAMLEAEVNAAHGELRQAQGDSWPTLLLGPSAKFSEEAGENLQQWGFNLSFPLPVFNTNGAGRSAAKLAAQSAEQRKSIGIQQLELQRASLEKTYKKSVFAFESAPGGKDLEQKHKTVEGLFMRGLVSSSLVIEAHRSLVEFEKIRNERELRAMEAFLEIQTLNGEKAEFDL
ncbi:MAG: TolC family protein [Bdellovibrio sp.]|nr:TolC family protein [Bdellovibrio sp.]